MLSSDGNTELQLYGIDIPLLINVSPFQAQQCNLVAETLTIHKHTRTLPSVSKCSNAIFAVAQIGTEHVCSLLFGAGAQIFGNEGHTDNESFPKPSQTNLSFPLSFFFRYHIQFFLCDSILLAHHFCHDTFLVPYVPDFAPCSENPLLVHCMG